MAEGEREGEGFGISRVAAADERPHETGRNAADPAVHATRGSARPSTRPSASVTEGLWDIEGVSTYLQIPVSSIYKMTAKKAAVRIPHIRIGGHLRFRKSDIDEWLSLLTVSNLATLKKVHRRVSERFHGDNSQAEALQR